MSFKPSTINCKLVLKQPSPAAGGSSKAMAGKGNREGGASVSMLALALCGLLVLAAAGCASAAACDPTALTPCTSAIMLGAAPTPGCCARLRAQQPCLCQYARDPSYRGYVTSPSAQRAVRACGVRANC